MTFVRFASACAIGGLAAATLTAPSAMAEPQDCSPAGIAGTVATTSTSAKAYLAAHPGANQAVMTAQNQPRGEASATLRNYFGSNPGEYNDLRGILAPIGNAQDECHVQALPPDLASAYSEFMAG
ncbi:heme-binding protein [Mycolicibacterium komossense]|uniref:Heme-binding protein n=1 Tax=Mycolicibacterium komossense TaxID=1779 RepID=A0ABT3CFJ8_9MYCO|nr:heme-binding protein [Mycolicibacterium komossense]MCV7228245.1 heme-binding protein [Mycolicibacterium komossense]